MQLFGPTGACRTVVPGTGPRQSDAYTGSSNQHADTDTRMHRTRSGLWHPARKPGVLRRLFVPTRRTVYDLPSHCHAHTRAGDSDARSGMPGFTGFVRIAGKLSGLHAVDFTN